jgi:hypothetical protein
LTLAQVRGGYRRKFSKHCLENLLAFSRDARDISCENLLPSNGIYGFNGTYNIPDIGIEHSYALAVFALAGKSLSGESGFNSADDVASSIHSLAE